METFGGYKTEAKEGMEIWSRLALRNTVKQEYIRDRNENVFARPIGLPQWTGPMDYAKMLKLWFRAGDLDLPERKKGYTSRKEEGKYAQMCPCGKANESRTDVVGQCEVCKEERDVLE